MTPDPAMLVHLCGVQEWSHARERGGIYPESDKTGYIHLSTLEQVHLPANRLYRGPVRAVIGAAAYPPAGDGSFGPAPEFRSATADPT